VLDSSYKLPTGGQDLLEAKHKYMYAVFERVLQMHKGKALVRSYEATQYNITV